MNKTIKSTTKRNRALSLTALFVVVFLMCIVAFPTTIIAKADEADWESGYTDYISSLDEDDLGEWYFDQANLDIYGALGALENILNDTRFDKELLKADPIVIAVIDSGIGYAYTTDGTEEIGVSSEKVFDEGVQYKLHPIFEDVLLTDHNGNYFYKNVTSEVAIRDNGTVVNTLNYVESGNIARDLVDDTSNDHGTHVTGMVAMLIHKLGLEDYIKILPVKANVNLEKEVKNGKTNYYAGYQIDTLEDAMDFCLENGADVVNLSLTAYKSGVFGSIDDGYKFEKYSDDMLIVASAGNKGDKIAGYPAATDKVLGVINYCLNDEGKTVIADSSNYGDWYDVAAPGTGITSSINGDEYGKLSGTSMATPIAAFASALAYFRYRGFGDYKIDPTPAIVHKMVQYCPNGRVYKDSYQCPKISFSNILSYEFQEDEYFLEKMGINVVPQLTSMQISADIKDEYKYGEVASITINAIPDPAECINYRCYNIEWYVVRNGNIEAYYFNDWSIEFPMHSTPGNYRVWAEYTIDNITHKTNEITFRIVGYKPDEVEIAVPEVDIYLVGEEYIFTAPVNYIYGPYLTKNVAWYINDELVTECTGYELIFAPEELGEYTIKAKVDGVQIGNVVTIYVTGKTEDVIADELEGWTEFIQAEVIRFIEIASIVEGCIVGGALIAFFIYLYIRKKKSGQIDSEKERDNVAQLYDNDNDLRG